MAIAITLRRFVPYVGAVEDVFGADIDFSQLIKVYFPDETTREHYSPGIVIDTVPKAITATLIPTTSARL